MPGDEAIQGGDVVTAAVPLRYHGPGWRVVMPDGSDAMLWAPRPEPGPADTYTHGREDWCAAWSNTDGSDGGFGRGTDAGKAIDAGLDGCPFVAKARVALYAQAVRHVAVSRR
jgi:hypothetical protein